MKLFKSDEFDTLFTAKEFYLDTDFLSFIYKNVDVFKDLYPILAKGFPLLDPLVMFEFFVIFS